MAKKSKIKFGKNDLLPKADLNSKDVKVRISILIEGDLLDAYKKAAKLTSHGQYQTLMKEKLREALYPSDTNQMELDLEFLKTQLRPYFIQIADDEIEERVIPKALKGA